MKKHTGKIQIAFKTNKERRETNRVIPFTGWWQLLMRVFRIYRSKEEKPDGVYIFFDKEVKHENKVAVPVKAMANVIILAILFTSCTKEPFEKPINANARIEFNVEGEHHLYSGAFNPVTNVGVYSKENVLSEGKRMYTLVGGNGTEDLFTVQLTLDSLVSGEYQLKNVDGLQNIVGWNQGKELYVNGGDAFLDMKITFVWSKIDGEFNGILRTRLGQQIEISGGEIRDVSLR